jgi:hypothetical protein
LSVIVRLHNGYLIPTRLVNVFNCDFLATVLADTKSRFFVLSRAPISALLQVIYLCVRINQVSLACPETPT